MTVFQVPRESFHVILDLPKEYGLRSLPDVHLFQPRVLDIGAHVGGFALYVSAVFPGARVMCFEPHPETFEFLVSNTAGLDIICNNAAVVFPQHGGKLRLYESAPGVGREGCSLRDDVRWPHCSQDLTRWVEVDSINAADLPPCDLLKVDTEGSEVEILTGYPHLNRVAVLLVEIHAVGGDLQGQAGQVQKLAEAAGLQLVGRSGIVLRFARVGLIG